MSKINCQKYMKIGLIDNELCTRKKIGRGLKSKREKQKRSINSFKDAGLQFREIRAIEQGLTNYTIDKLLQYYNELSKLN